MTRTLRGKVAVAGLGETTYYKHGRSPDAERKLALEAIIAACRDAGIPPAEIDGFSSYSDDRNTGPDVAAALGCRELRFSNMVWGGGGGGTAGAVANAAAAIASGMADCVVVYRALAQGQFARFGRGPEAPTVSGEAAHTVPYGLLSPAQIFAMRVMRFMHEHGVGRAALRAIAMASYAHAQANPRAIMRGRPLAEEAYDASRWIVEPFRLYDCCQENDGAAALILVSAERAREFGHPPCYLLAAAGGGDRGAWAPVHNDPDYATANFKTVAKRLYEMAGVGPSDIDVVQAYENFTGGVLMALVEFGFCLPEEVDTYFTLERFRAPGGALPLNTSGGNLAECYMHGLGLVLEAVRQIRGTSTSQVPGADLSLMIAGPMVSPATACLFGSESTL